MKKLASLMILTVLSISSFAFQKSSVDYNGTLVAFSKENNGALVTVKGSAAGPELMDQTGNIADILDAMGINMVTDIPSKLKRQIFKLRARGPRATRLHEIKEDVLDQMAKTASFSWSVEKQLRTVWTVSVIDENKLKRHLNKKEGTKSYSYISGRKFEMINTLEAIFQKLHEEYLKKDLPLYMDDLKSGQSFNIKLDIRSERRVIDRLIDQYGIELKQEPKEIDVLTLR